MHLKTVTSLADLPFKGIELVRVDKNITEVVIGGKLRIRQDGTYSPNLKLLVERPYEEAERYRVTATIDGFDPKVSYCETEYEAKQAVTDFEGKGATAAFDKIKALLNDAGEVVGTVEPPAPASTVVSEDAYFIPF